MGDIVTLNTYQIMDRGKGAFIPKIERTNKTFKNRYVYVGNKSTPHEFRFILQDESPVTPNLYSL